jgi:flavin-dependent dehydrogenase
VGAFPFTGQGIYRALLSGDIAGRCIGQKKIKKYPSIIRYEFTQWNVIGSAFIRLNQVFQRINPGLFFTSLNFVVKRSKLLNVLVH